MMRNQFRSVRWRLQLWHALILMGVIVALCLLAFRLAAEDRRQRVERELETFERDFMRSFWNLPSNSGKDGPPSPGAIRRRFLELDDPTQFPLELRGLFDPDARESTYLAFWDGDAKLLFRSANAPASLGFPAKIPVDQGSVGRIRGHFHELVHGGPRGFRGIVGRDISAERAALVRLGWQIAAGGTAIWLLGLVGGWWLAGRVIQPIATISRTASRIAGGALAERIEIASADDELGRLSQVLNDTFDRLAAGIDRQREFTADASHELRTPLTVILAETSRGLKRARPEAEYREILDNCHHAATRMRSLVESLLLLARQDGNPPEARASVDLAEIAADSIRLHQPLADAREIRLSADFSPSRCLAEADALGIAIGNLIANAIAHQPPGGAATVRVFAADGRAIVEIRDLGPGIPDEHLPRLFDRFYRIDPARGPASGHSGLGLSIVRAIVENHDGKVTVASEPGHGSAFRIDLPEAG